MAQRTLNTPLERFAAVEAEEAEKRPFTTERRLHEVVELVRDCELGEKGERAVVTFLEGKYMTLVFPMRVHKFNREAHTGADYRYLKGV